MNNNGILNFMAHLKNLIEGGRYMEGRREGSLYKFFVGFVFFRPSKSKASTWPLIIHLFIGSNFLQHLVLHQMHLLHDQLRCRLSVHGMSSYEQRFDLNLT